MKLKLLMIASCICLLISGCVKSNPAEIDGNVVTEGCQFPSNIVRISDKIYYNYYTNNVKTSGIYEISSKGSSLYKEVEEGNPEFTPKMNLMLIYHNSFVPQTFSKELEGKSISELKENYFNGIFTDMMVVDNKLYAMAYTKKEGSVLYSYENDGFKKLISIADEMLTWYPCDEEIYYITANMNTYQEYINHSLMKGYISNNKSEKLMDLEYDKEYVEKMIVADNNVFILSETSSVENVKRLDVYNISNNEHSELARASDVDIAYSNDITYYCAVDGQQKGIFKYSLSANEKLCDDAVKEIDVFDDKYIYFVEDKNKLCRLNQNGENKEILFG